MANTKISALTGGNPAQTGDLLPIDRSGSNFSVTAASVAALGGLTVTSPGCFWGVQIYFKDTGGNGPVSNPGADAVQVCAFVLPFAMTVSKLTFDLAVEAAATHMNIGLYNQTKNKVIDSGAIDSSTPGFKTITLGSPVALAAGVYWLAWSADDASNTLRVPVITNTDPWATSININVNRWGVAANSTSSGVLPATLGVITPGGQSFPLEVLFEA